MTFASKLSEFYERREAEKLERDTARKALNMRTLCHPYRGINRGIYEGGTAEAVPKEPEPVRDESYRRWVASLPCYECRIEGFSNAAHPNSGKTKGVKRDDDECFPMCVDRPGIKGCHARFDQYEIVSREQMPAYEAAALQWTKEQATQPERT